MRHVHATTDDPVVAALSEVVGGPMGPRAAAARWGTPLAVLLALTAFVFALGMVSKTTCAEAQWHAGNREFSHLCHSDIPVTYTDTGLVQMAWPWTSDEQVRARFATVDQPALVGLWAYAAARVTYAVVGSPDLGPRYAVDASTLGEDDGVRHEQAVFVAVNAVGLALVALLATGALVRSHRRRPWDAAAFAVAPVLATAGLVSWDLLPAAAAAGALLAWTRRRPAWAGALVGVGAAAGVWPLLLVVAFAADGWRRRRHPGLTEELLPAVVSALAAWVVLNAPAYLSGRPQWEAFWRVAATRGPEAGSFWTVIDQGVGISDDLARGLSWLLIAVWLIGVAVLAVHAPSRPRPAQIAFLAVAGVALLGVTYRPQEALWLLPLAALARPRWRDQLVWQAGELFYAAMLWWWLGGYLAPSGGGAAGFYWLAIGVRIVCTAWLVGVVVRDVWWVEHDPVRELRELAQDTTTRSNAVVV